jgi:hypothetical protein
MVDSVVAGNMGIGGWRRPNCRMSPIGDTCTGGPWTLQVELERGGWAVEAKGGDGARLVDRPMLGARLLKACPKPWAL